MDVKKAAIIKSVEKILKDDTSFRLFFNSINCLKLSLKRFVCLIIFWIIFYVLYVAFFVNYIDGVKSTIIIINNVNIIIIPIFAIIITGYAIFQALTNGKTLLALLKANDEEMNKFQEYNYFFFAISILYLFIIITNFLLSVIVGSLPEGWFLPHFTAGINNNLFSILISMYIIFVLNALIEMKSFVYNLYQLFSSHAIASAIEQLKQKD